MDSSLVMGPNLWLGVFNILRIDGFEGFLAVNCGGEVLG